MFILLHPPTNADGGDGGQGRIDDIMDGDFSIKEELKVLRNEGFGRLQGPGGDLFVVGFRGLAPLRGMKTGVLSQGNPIKNGALWVERWQCFDVFDHPKSHLRLGMFS